MKLHISDHLVLDAITDVLLEKLNEAKVEVPPRWGASPSETIEDRRFLFSREAARAAVAKLDKEFDCE